MRVVTSRAEFAEAREGLGGDVGLVPTMGALHEGHASLLRAARGGCTSVVATIFVNPLQFGPGEDLARYPRSLDADLAMCAREGVDLVWAPEVADIYPLGDSRVTVSPGPLGSELEGVVRPGHFTGVLTVVAKFLGLVRPARAFFGEKDYQQLTLIRQLVGDLELRADIVGVPTVREPDGLALSSRNVFLSPTERRAALALSRALAAGAAAAGAAPEVIAAAQAVLTAEPGIELDYLALRGVGLDAVPEHGAARLLVAARVGTTRLIDNTAVQL